MKRPRLSGLWLGLALAINAFLGIVSDACYVFTAKAVQSTVLKSVQGPDICAVQPRTTLHALAFQTVYALCIFIICWRVRSRLLYRRHPHWSTAPIVAVSGELVKWAFTGGTSICQVLIEQALADDDDAGRPNSSNVHANDLNAQNLEAGSGERDLPASEAAIPAGYAAAASAIMFVGTTAVAFAAMWSVLPCMQRWQKRRTEQRPPWRGLPPPSSDEIDDMWLNVSQQRLEPEWLLFLYIYASGLCTRAMHEGYA